MRQGLMESNHTQAEHLGPLPLPKDWLIDLLGEKYWLPGPWEQGAVLGCTPEKNYGERSTPWNFGWTPKMLENCAERGSNFDERTFCGFQLSGEDFFFRLLTCQHPSKKKIPRPCWLLKIVERARRVLSQFNKVALRTRKVLLLYKVNGDSALLVLIVKKR